MSTGARRLGAIGGKISGAGGGGGFMSLICPFDRKAAIVDRLSQLGAKALPVAFQNFDVTSWFMSPIGRIRDSEGSDRCSATALHAGRGRRDFRAAAEHDY